ncbi:MAG: RNase adapter RapZ [Chromatiales bacterium]
MKLQIVTGMSGSGKTIALHTLEDMGYYCIDNLPVSILEAVALHLTSEPEAIFCKTAVGVDARSQSSQIPQLPELVRNMRRQGLDVNVLFIDAQNETLIKRFSETRRKHPLTDNVRSLDEAIRHERLLLEPLSTSADLRIDTSHTNLHELRDLIHNRLSDNTVHASVMFESFGFKHGVPRDADFVFDVRCLPNPYWEASLRSYSGLDKPVADFLDGHTATHSMLNDLIRFFEHWIPTFEADGRSYLTIAIGCTGGQHRSVYLVDHMTRHFKAQGFQVISRHRELS